jgi:hypothetical protein
LRFDSLSKGSYAGGKPIQVEVIYRISSHPDRSVRGNPIAFQQVEALMIRPKNPDPMTPENRLAAPRTRGHAGQELAEFAIVVPLLILVAFGVLDLGRAFQAAIAVESAARVGARYATFHPDDATIIRLETRKEAQNSGVPLNAANSTVDVACTDAGDCTAGHPVQVTVTYAFPLVLDVFLPSPINIVGRAEMMIP